MLTNDSQFTKWKAAQHRAGSDQPTLAATGRQSNPCSICHHVGGFHHVSYLRTCLVNARAWHPAAHRTPQGSRHAPQNSVLLPSHWNTSAFWGGLAQRQETRRFQSHLILLSPLPLGSPQLMLITAHSQPSRHSPIERRFPVVSMGQTTCRYQAVFLKSPGGQPEGTPSSSPYPNSHNARVLVLRLTRGHLPFCPRNAPAYDPRPGLFRFLPAEPRCLTSVVHHTLSESPSNHN